MVRDDLLASLQDLEVADGGRDLARRRLGRLFVAACRYQGGDPQQKDEFF